MSMQSLSLKQNTASLSDVLIKFQTVLSISMENRKEQKKQTHIQEPEQSIKGVAVKNGRWIFKCQSHHYFVSEIIIIISGLMHSF